jgi:hypothetical protein
MRARDSFKFYQATTSDKETWAKENPQTIVDFWNFFTDDDWPSERMDIICQQSLSLLDKPVSNIYNYLIISKFKNESFYRVVSSSKKCLEQEQIRP